MRRNYYNLYQLGSGTTAIACINANRNFIGFEIDKDYYDMATKRLETVKSQKTIFDFIGR